MANIDPTLSTPNITSSPEGGRIKPLFLGVWADQLEVGDELPVAGSRYGNQLSISLELDFDNLGIDLSKIDSTHFHDAYMQSEPAIKEWLAQIGSTMDPYTFFVCNSVQGMVHRILEVDRSQDDAPDPRASHYLTEGAHPRISQLKGNTRCAERAALAQYLLQAIGLESAYVGGMTKRDAHDDNELTEPHSFIVVKPHSGGAGYIFDVARPRSSDGLPRIMVSTQPVSYELLAPPTDNLLVQGRDCLSGDTLYFGVEEISPGPHNIIE